MLKVTLQMKIFDSDFASLSAPKALKWMPCATNRVVGTLKRTTAKVIFAQLHDAATPDAASLGSRVLHLRRLDPSDRASESCDPGGEVRAESDLACRPSLRYMLSRDACHVQSMDDNWSGACLLGGLTSNFPGVERPGMGAVLMSWVCRNFQIEHTQTKNGKTHVLENNGANGVWTVSHTQMDDSNRLLKERF